MHVVHIMRASGSIRNFTKPQKRKSILLESASMKVVIDIIVHGNSWSLFRSRGQNMRVSSINETVLLFTFVQQVLSNLDQTREGFTHKWQTLFRFKFEFRVTSICHNVDRDEYSPSTLFRIFNSSYVKLLYCSCVPVH